MDRIPSKDSEDEFDGYVDNPIILNAGEATSSFQNYTNSSSPVHNNTVLKGQAPSNSDDDYHSYQILSSSKSPTTLHTFTPAQILSVIRPILTINPQQLCTDSINPRR